MENLKGVRRGSAPTICIQADIDQRLCSNLFDGENQSRKHLMSYVDGTRKPDNEILG